MFDSKKDAVFFLCGIWMVVLRSVAVALRAWRRQLKKAKQVVLTVRRQRRALRFVRLCRVTASRSAIWCDLVLARLRHSRHAFRSVDRLREAWTLKSRSTALWSVWCEVCARRHVVHPVYSKVVRNEWSARLNAERSAFTCLEQSVQCCSARRADLDVVRETQRRIRWQACTLKASLCLRSFREAASHSAAARSSVAVQIAHRDHFATATRRTRRQKLRHSLQQHRSETRTETHRARLECTHCVGHSKDRHHVSQ